MSKTGHDCSEGLRCRLTRATNVGELITLNNVLGISKVAKHRREDTNTSDLHYTKAKDQ